MSARLSVREFAKRAGCDEKQVRRALEKGLISKGDDGLLDAEQVGGAWRKPNRRGVEKLSAQPVRTTANVRTPRRRADNSAAAPNVRTDETPEEAAERIVAQAGLLSLKDALELKENYLARHQQLSYDLKAGTVVLIEEVTKTVGAEYAGVRKKLLAIPAERAPAVHRLKTVAEVEALLRSVIVEALEGLTRDGSPSA
ncbi:hypothetical protein [Sphingomonas sp. CARO-RG-8B-R24-01]|uniref:hypothetical protein n=1 Tax=Sphingomonas sp. CARO-RG-8B-R24-01 TaxID=2914831 RepID=UPI001F55FA26|nr:hypothetical protein [Sphingomonas sp. CARO-RG-8B-R24-01]